MKKLMIAMSVAVMAIATNAATINWATNQDGILTDPSGNQLWNGDGYMKMYMWSIDSTAYAGLTEGGASAVSAKVWDAYGSIPAGSSMYAEDGGGQMLLTDATVYGGTATAYAAILFTFEDPEGNVTHYIGNAGAWTFTDPNENKTIYGMDKVIFGSETGSTAVAWAAVPEPTSGLLLLLGMAGLALRRRRV